MSRYWLALVLVAAGLLAGCGGGGTASSAIPGKGVAVPGQLALSLSSSDFGSVAVGSSSVRTGVLAADSSPVTISSGSGSGNGFSISGISYPVTLAAGQSISFTVTFAPQTTGAVSDSISFISNASNSPASEALTGTGTTPAGNGGGVTAQLSLSLSPSNFGNVTVGSSSAKTGTLSAGSSAAVTVSSGSGTGSGFSLSGISFPVTIGAGHSISFTLTFAPQAAGATSGNISFLSNAANSPTSEAVAGTGTAATIIHSVSLSWTPSPSQVIGYNVYRGTAPGGPYPSKLTPTPQLATSLVDNTVVGGMTYYYVATSVDDNSVESVYSDQIIAAVP
jgi:Abnormal spindle-like microcephaly-assoc'd, ASPM-SPD-2-Hydin